MGALLAIDSTIASIFAVQDGVVSRSQALDAGATENMIRSRLEHQVWRRVLPGVYALAGASPTWRQTLRAACLWTNGFVSHRAAAAVHELAGFAEGIVEITTAANVSHRNLVVHRSEEMMKPWTTTRHGLPLTTVPRTLIDLCAVVRRDRIEEAFDAASTKGLITARHQWRYMNRMGTQGRRGTGGLRQIVADRMQLGAHPASVAETRFARLLRESSLPPVEFQCAVRDGHFLARLDAAWPEVLLGVEIDGWMWHSSRPSRRRDTRRQNHLERLGWTILRFFWEDIVADKDYVLAEIGAAYRALTRAL